MPQMSPPPPRPSSANNADVSHAGHSSPGNLAHAGLLGGDLDAQQEQGLSVADFFAQALEGAMTLVRADGGEIATLDDTRQVLVLRARRTRPRIDAHPHGPIGTAGRASQPMFPPSISQHGTSNPGASIAGSPRDSGLHGIADETADMNEIEIQSTLLLPATMVSRTYRKGERLIGYAWQRSEPVIMSGEQCRGLHAGSAPADPDAAFHLAVPILRPSSLAMTRPNTEVIGVISVYNRDPLWPFSARDVEQLTLHADRVARAMRVADLSRQNQGQQELLDVLGSDINGAGEHTLYPRLRDVVRRLIDAPSFAVLLYDARQDAVTFELAERDRQPTPLAILPASALPPWWHRVRNRQSVWISAPEDRAAHPEFGVLGWGGDQPVQSLLAAPLLIGTTLVGAIVAGSPRPDVYAPEHAHLFTTIARSAAIVIQNARLAHETRTSLAKTYEKQRQLSILNNAVLTLMNASLDRDETVRALVGQAAHLTDATNCVVFLRDEADADYLVGSATNAPSLTSSTWLSDVRIPLDWRGLKAVIEREPFIMLDNLETEWTDDIAMGRLLAEDQIRSALVLPISQKDGTHADGIQGVLAVYTPGQRHHFRSEEVGLLQGLVSQAAVALSNALLFKEQQETNAKLQDAFEKQKELDRLKDEFILTVSHEFRTPVTAIEGYVTLISRHGHKLEQAKLDQFASEIHQATNQLTGMINMLHDANSLSDHPLQLTLRPVHLRAVAEKAIATQSPEAKARMMLRLPDTLWALADGDRLIHVFTNLLSNAIKYSPADSPCELTARVETRETLAAQGRPRALAEGAPDRWVVVGVRDKGIGITTEDLAKLFQKFVRLSRSLTTSVRGTGLGLWICRQYLDAMGGDIWVESEFGKGSNFQFSLPYATPEVGAL